ncbi:MAG: Yip1 domain protein [Candidatus Bathyarchaeota archaeon BA1]|nr:MAG: Yip1 domain protein [Candidatus Bathyarchaeota archaeon BA1]
MVGLEILKVFYSPFKAFEEIVKKPDAKGPLLIFGLVLLATMGAQYVNASKIFLETETPGEYACLLTRDVFSGYLIQSLTNTAFSFIVNWVMYSALLLLIIRFFRVETGPWQVFFIITGYVFSVTIIYVLANALLISTLPTLRLPLKAWNPITDEEKKAAQIIINQIYQEGWGPNLAYQVGIYFSYTIDLWIAGLMAIAIHFSHELPWRKAVYASVIATVINLFLRSFILG